jgi:hypothetical protein
MGKLQLINLVLFWLLMGMLGAHFAKKRGRQPLAWFGITLMLGIFGFAMLFLLPKIGKKNNIAPSYKPPRIIERSDSWLKMWYYLDHQHVQQGPFEFPDFIKTWKEKHIGEMTYVWGEGMTEWKQLRSQPELLQELDQA